VKSEGILNWHEIVGANIRRLRRAQGETQAELADAAGIDVRGLGSIERGEGNPSLDTLIKLAEALSVSADEFFRTPPP
jgi:transcriptional regulator with XRE-family HTH domain